jgi:hypothetical protein
MIAHRAALDILKGEKRNSTSELECDPTDPVPDHTDDEPELSPRAAWVSVR